MSNEHSNTENATSFTMNEHDKTSNGDKVQMFVLGRGDNPQQQYSLPIHDFTDSSAYDDLRGSGDVTIQTLNLHSRIPIPGPHLVNEYSLRRYKESFEHNSIKHVYTVRKSLKTSDRCHPAKTSG